MAEQIPYGVATSIINNLASFAFSEFGRIYGVNDELKKLKETLDSIKVVISGAELSQLQDPINDHWIERFKQVLIDADDLLDDLAIKDLRRKVNNDGGNNSASKGLTVEMGGFIVVFLEVFRLHQSSLLKFEC